MSLPSPDLIQALHARVRYYRDLGIYDLYRRAQPEIAVADLESVTVTNTEPEPPLPPPKVVSPSLPVIAVETSADPSAALRAIQDELHQIQISLVRPL